MPLENYLCKKKSQSDANGIKNSIKPIKDREHWSKPIEFFLSCVGYSVGLGNIWRFPYLCMQNGGGAFLIPYFTCLLISGMPMFFMELIMGQYSGQSPVCLFNLCPIFKGVGWGMLIVSAVMCIYYNIIIAWTIYYLVKSFSWELPWKHCGNTWNTPLCYSSYFFENDTAGLMNYTHHTYVARNISARPRSSTEEFWLFNALDISDGIGQLEGIHYEMLGCFAGAWLLTYVCLYKGIKSIGKVVYVTATLPYVFLTVILIRGVTLEGSMLGLNYYILNPDWSRLKNFQTWAAAALQIFYSLGPAWGGLITMSSYNKFNHNSLRDAIAASSICCLTSFYGGFAIFSIIGHMAHMSNQTNLEAVVQSGPGLAFVVYPQALSQLPGSAIWSVFFFVMLITLGLDSMFSTLETTISGISDQFPKLLRKHKQLWTMFVCASLFLIGILFTTRAGVYYFQILDWYFAVLSVMIIGLLEIIIFMYIYGVFKFFRSAEIMLGKIHIIFKSWFGLTLCVLSPIQISFIIFWTLYGFEPPVFDASKSYPIWAICIGWLFASLSVLPIPIVALIDCVRKKGNIKKLFLPNDQWKLSLEKRLAESENCSCLLNKKTEPKLRAFYNFKSTPL